MKKLLILTAAFLTMASTQGATESATTLLKGFEGFRPTVYKCEAGKDTIGYGFTSKELIAKGRMTEEEAFVELSRLCDTIAEKLRAELGGGTPLSSNEEAALVSFIFNVGWANFKSSTMCRLLKEGKRGASVALEFHRWVYVTKGGKKVVSRGLRNRREKESAVFLGIE